MNSTTQLATATDYWAPNWQTWMVLGAMMGMGVGVAVYMAGSSISVINRPDGDGKVVVTGKLFGFTVAERTGTFTAANAAIWKPMDNWFKGLTLAGGFAGGL